MLKDFELSSFWFSAVYAQTSRNAFKLRLLIDHIAAQYKRLPTWDAELIALGLLSEELIME